MLQCSWHSSHLESCRIDIKKGITFVITCINCGRAIPDTAAMCPNCGTSVSASASWPIPERPSFTPPEQAYMPPFQTESGYRPPQPQAGYMQPPQPGYMPPQQGYYGQQQMAPPMYQQGPAVNVTVVNNTSGQANTPLILEIILSIFGVYGVGWLMAGETTTGIVLLVCSFLVYWPIMVFMGIFTVGICDFPFAIAAIVINAILLNGVLKRKMAQNMTIYTR